MVTHNTVSIILMGKIGNSVRGREDWIFSRTAQYEKIIFIVLFIFYLYFLLTSVLFICIVLGKADIII